MSLSVQPMTPPSPYDGDTSPRGARGGSAKHTPGNFGWPLSASNVSSSNVFGPSAPLALALRIEPSQLAAHDLARRSERQLGHELDLARIFMGSEPRLHEVGEVGLER